MKKTLTLTLAIFGLFLLCTSFVFAQDKLQKCIKVRADVKISAPIPTNTTRKVLYEKGVVIVQGPVSADECSAGAIDRTRTGAVGGDCLLHLIPIIGEPNTFKVPRQEGGQQVRCYTDDFGLIFILSIIGAITGWAFYLLTTAAVLMFVYSGFLYITAAGDPVRAGKGKKVLTFAIIGLALGFLARIIPGVVKYIIGAS